jgi:hypothetical protein
MVEVLLDGVDRREGLAALGLDVWRRVGGYTATQETL